MVVQPKPNVGSHDYRPKLYNILLLDHKNVSGENGKPTKYLPTFHLMNNEEPGDEILTNVFKLTGGDHGGIKGNKSVNVKCKIFTFLLKYLGFGLFSIHQFISNIVYFFCMKIIFVLTLKIFANLYLSSCKEFLVLVCCLWKILK